MAQSDMKLPGADAVWMARQDLRAEIVRNLEDAATGLRVLWAAENARMDYGACSRLSRTLRHTEDLIAEAKAYQARMETWDITLNSKASSGSASR